MILSFTFVYCLDLVHPRFWRAEVSDVNVMQHISWLHSVVCLLEIVYHWARCLACHLFDIFLITLVMSSTRCQLTVDGVCRWQLFWEKRLEGLFACDKNGEKMTTLQLPRNIQGKLGREWIISSEKCRRTVLSFVTWLLNSVWNYTISFAVRNSHSLHM